MNKLGFINLGSTDSRSAPCQEDPAAPLLEVDLDRFSRKAFSTSTGFDSESDMGGSSFLEGAPFF